MAKQKGKGDVLNQPRKNADTFTHYLGPCGGDMRQSISGPCGDNRDEAGGDQVYNKKGKGRYGPTRPY